MVDELHIGVPISTSTIDYLLKQQVQLTACSDIKADAPPAPALHQYLHSPP